jgi:integrase/recombinase XerD
MEKKHRSKPVMMKFRMYLQLEKALQPNSVEAYLSDIDKLLGYFGRDESRMTAANIDDLRGFLASLTDIGINARSQARLLSAIRSFYQFMKLDGYIEHDNSELLKSPKLAMNLPEVLTLQEIDDIINSIDLSKNEGQRNRAMIEVLYSCGLRVSELCNLTMHDLFLDDGFLRVVGKGNKERLVPISPKAIKELQLWFFTRNTILPKSGEEDYVFLSVRRRQHLSHVLRPHKRRRSRFQKTNTKRIDHKILQLNLFFIIQYHEPE